MDRFTPEDIWAVLHNHNIKAARRATPLDNTEEVILLDPETYARIDVKAVTLAMMDVLPHIKVWFAPDGPRWESEPL